MEGPKRKVTARVEPSSVRTPGPSRPVSRAASPVVTTPVSKLDESLSPPSDPARPKLKVTASSTIGSKTTPKSSGSTINAGRKTPVWSAAGRARDRPNSVVSPPKSPFRPTTPVAPRRAPSPLVTTRPRARSPDPPRPATGTRTVRKPPTPNVLSPPAPKRAVSPARRRNPSPTRATQTLPRRTTSPARSSVFGSQSRASGHRRVASASASSIVSGVESTPQPEVTKARLKLPSSLSAITLTRPSSFSAIPPSPPQSAYPELPSPALPLNNDRDSSPEPLEHSAPPSAVPHGLLSAQDTNRAVASAPVTPTHLKTDPPTPNLKTEPSTPLGFSRPRISSITIVPDEEYPPEPEPEPEPERPMAVMHDSSPKDEPPVRIKAKVTHIIPSSTPPAKHTPPRPQPLVASPRPQTHTTSPRPQTLAAPRQRSGSVSANSSLSGVATSTLSRTSSVRVTSASRILSPPLDRPIHALGLGIPGFTFPAPSSAIRSPPASILSTSSSTSRGSSSSRTDSSTHSTSVGRERSGTVIRAKITAFTGPEDDSGIDMFEADDGGVREEARSNRKIADLEISNKSLLAINATLEATKSRQAKEIRDLRRRLRESRLVLPPTAYKSLEKSDPLNTSFDEDDDDEDDDDDDVTQLQADETFARVRNMLDQLTTAAKEALESQPVLPEPDEPVKRPIRVLNMLEDESTENSVAEYSVAGSITSIDDLPDPDPDPDPEPEPSFVGRFTRWTQ